MSYKCSITKKVVHNHRRCLLVQERLVPVVKIVRDKKGRAKKDENGRPIEVREKNGRGEDVMRREIASEAPISPEVWAEYFSGKRELGHLQRLEPTSLNNRG